MLFLGGHRLLGGGGGGAPFAGSLLCCLCALFAQNPAVAFVPGSGSSLPVSRYGNNEERSSCRLAVGGAPTSGSGGARVAASRRRSGGAGAPLSMMFDTLAENMSAVANLFTGATTITESRYEAETCET